MFYLVPFPDSWIIMFQKNYVNNKYAQPLLSICQLDVSQQLCTVTKAFYFSVLLSWLTAHFYLKLSSSQHSAIKLCQQTKVIRYWVVNLSANNGQGVAITLQPTLSWCVWGPLYQSQLVSWLTSFKCFIVNLSVDGSKNIPSPEDSGASQDSNECCYCPKQ